MDEKISQNGTDEAQDKKAKKAAKHDGGVADLERVTDYAEEKELSSADISNVKSPHFNLTIFSVTSCFHVDWLANSALIESSLNRQ